MRAKKAKALRRMAERVTEGLPNRQLMVNEKGTVINNPKTTRGVYRRWKKLAPKGRKVFSDE